MRIYGYLRASTKEQDATRAQNQLIEFADSVGQGVAAWFIENESGATLKRPELFRLLDVANAGDVLLVEQVDRISRLNTDDWETLKTIITSKSIKIVALDLPTSHQFLKASTDEFTGRMFTAINAMLLDMLAAVARKDYEDRRKRQKQGVQAAKEQGKYRGRQTDETLHRKIEGLLQDGKSYSHIVDLLGCSRATIAKVKKSINTQ